MQESASWIAGSQAGYVAGIVGRPLTPMERAGGAIGHTEEEWLAYNKLAGKHPLKDNHGRVVGRVVQTYVDVNHNLCAAGLLDRDQASLWESVRDGRVHSFSIGYDAIRELPGEPYKNKNFEVSLTQTPRKPHAVINVRCSMTEPNTTPVTPTPPAEPAPTAMDVDLLRELQLARENAAKWQAHQAAKEQKRLDERMRAVTAAAPVLRGNGMDGDDPGQRQILEAIARTNGSEQFLTAMSGVAATVQKMQEENARLAALAAAREQDAQQLERLRRQIAGVTSAPAAGDAKRATLTPASWAATPAAEMTPAQALALNLNSIDKGLFSSAARTAAPAADVSLFEAAAAAAARGAATPTAPPAAEDVAREQFDGRVEMPKTPEEQLRMVAHYVADNKPPLQVEVRCSDGSETAGQVVFSEYLMKHPTCFANTIPKLRGAITPNEAELFFRNDAFWNNFANETSSMLLRSKDNVYGEFSMSPKMAEECMNLPRPGWDNSADLRAFLTTV